MNLNSPTSLKNTGIRSGVFFFLKSKKEVDLNEKMTLSIISFVFLLLVSNPSLAQSKSGDHDHTHHAGEHEHEHVSSTTDQMPKKTKLITGQGAFVFFMGSEANRRFP